MIKQPHCIKRKGVLLLVSGPSGSGKTTLCRRLALEKEAFYTTSCTTRAPRTGEQDGKDYYFLSEEDFLLKKGQGAFLECATVHGHWYGTLKSEVFCHLESGRDVVIDIDVQGAQLIREQGKGDAAIAKSLVDCFVMPPSKEALYARLSGRGTDSQEVINVRMNNALGEMEHWQRYAFCLLSGSHEEDYAALLGLLVSQRMASCRLAPPLLDASI